MVNIKTKRLLSFTKRLTSIDSEILHRHVKDMPKFSKALTKIEGSHFSDEHLSEEDLNTLEAIVMNHGRPVFNVENDNPTNVKGLWSDRLENHMNSISENIKSVGRIELNGHPLQAYLEPDEELFIGTCSVIGPDLLLTNRHVALEFCFVNGLIKPRMTARVDFVEESQRDPDNEIKIVKAIKIGEKFDFAILQTDGTPLPTPVKFASSPKDIPSIETDPFVYIIGYPKFDTRNPTDIQYKLFGNKFSIKRFSPGRLRSQKSSNQSFISKSFDTSLILDYTSLGGNSGSPVFELETGLMIGLHYAGRYAEANYAIPIWSILDQINVTIQNSTGERRETVANNYVESLLKERVLYMPFDKARQVASSQFNPQSANEVTNAAAAYLVLNYFGDHYFKQNLLAALSAVHPTLGSAIVEVSERGNESPYPPQWDDWSPTRPTLPWNAPSNPPWKPPPWSPPWNPPGNPPWGLPNPIYLRSPNMSYNITEAVGGQCIAGTIGGAGLGGLSGASLGPVGIAIGVISGGLAGAAASGCFK